MKAVPALGMGEDSGRFVWLKIGDMGKCTWPSWPSSSVNDRIINEMPGVDIEQVLIIVTKEALALRNACIRW